MCILKTTKKNWDSLVVNYERNEDVQLHKVVTLTRPYKSFTIKDGESIANMFGRVQVLLNGLEALGQGFLKAHINLKLLDNMPKIWEPKATTISKARDLKKLTWDEFFKILRVHKVHCMIENRRKLQKS